MPDDVTTGGAAEYRVDPPALTTYSRSAWDIADEYYWLAGRVEHAVVPDGAAGRVRQSAPFVQAYLQYQQGVREECTGGALAMAYFSEATWRVTDTYVRTDAEAGQRWGHLLAAPGTDVESPLTGPAGG